MSDDIVEFNWKEPVFCAEGMELFPRDTLDRARYASFLHNYLAVNAIDGGYVLNLNAKWGSGKTYFINRWMESIKDTHPVVYIDAWKQDYSDDPMLTVISSLINALSEQLPVENEILSNITEKSARFIKAAAPALLKGLVKKAVGLNLDDIKVEGEPKSDDKFISDTLSESAAAVAQCLVKDHNDKLQSVEYLRNEIKALITAVIAHKQGALKVPAFIFIDELDRCRPSYALEMLEVVKHFFELDNIAFIVATDTEQLQHAVKAVYGEGFDAQTYLGRFFRRRYSLTELSRYEFVSHITENKVTYNPKWKEFVPSLAELDDFTNVVSIVADRFRLSLRETEQLTDKFLAVLSNTAKTLNPYLLLILFVLRDKHYYLYADWLDTTSTNHTHFDNLIGRIDYKIDNFFVLYGSSGGFFAREVGNSNCVRLSSRLAMVLSDMNSLCLEDRNEILESLNYDYHRVSNHTEKVFLLYKIDLLKLSANKIDYKNWVELAVSFDK
ncbi:KAP family P-loop NTPase fold protein [Shewanella xiamenensis]|uniref:KAP family P-loop NTPase fold protein n=1 Tax=Shewanella xiamenensis TaxID=332186 RepID=UPI000DB24AC9|nr:P-loop NTPase fold protein [Shewanella xiamenensis]PZP38200.1 MAG: NTPase [Shewanella oneidensis]MBW0279565.1 NTPase [Shewanella xiamenensis]MCT8862203.1 KAP family NTPase [Shewanella xiamenensis]MCT8871767.1 KAP family NTPase [Shewanella xiamenensis]MCT8875354.1 KAP family NTPase [Shewanella xiamenensis]